MLLSLRIALGGLLIASGVAKMANMQVFADAVVAYGILPTALARLFAGVLPWAELFVGCSLVLGIFIVPAAVLCLLMSLSFVVANCYALFHDVGKACSCLGTLVTMSHPMSLGVDVAMIAVATLLVVKRGNAKSFSLGAVTRYGRLGLKGRTWVVLQSAIVAITMIAIAASIRTPDGWAGTQIEQALELRETVVAFFWTGDPSETALHEKFQMLSDLEYKYASTISIVRVEYSQDPRSVRSFGIKSSPTLLVITGGQNGTRPTIVGRLEGDFEEAEVEDLLQRS